MVLALLTLASTLIPSAAIRCAIPIVDLLWKKDDAVEMVSVREAMAKIPVERISRVVNEFYQGCIPEDLFGDLVSKVSSGNERGNEQRRADCSPPPDTSSQPYSLRSSRTPKRILRTCQG